MPTMVLCGAISGTCTFPRSSPLSRVSGGSSVESHEVIYTYSFERGIFTFMTCVMSSPMRRRTSSHAASASELNFRLSMKRLIRTSSSQAEVNRVRKSCCRVIPSPTSYVHDSFLCKHLTHDGLSPEHYRRKKSALPVTLITSSLVGLDHLDFPSTAQITGRASHMTFACIVIQAFVGVGICHCV